MKVQDRRQHSATVAVILSNYNHARYLPESLAGICGQTRPADEVIVIDDGSTDCSMAVIEDFARRYPVIRVFRNERNLGLQESIARTLPLLTADYLVWAASDDRLLPLFIEKSMALLERHPEAGLCFSELSVIRDDTAEIARFAVMPGIEHIFDLSDLPEYVAPAGIVRRMRRAYLPMTSNSVVVRLDALLSIGGYPGELEWHSDSFAYTVLALRHGACVVAETLALLRATPGSYSQQGMRDEARQTAIIARMLDRLRRSEYRDVRHVFRRCPSNFSPWHTLMFRVQLRRPGDWDLLLAYLGWKVREYRRGHRLGWGRTVAHLGVRLLYAMGIPRVTVLLEKARHHLRSIAWIRNTVIFFRWVLGRQHAPWTASPAHTVVAALSRRASRGTTRLHRLAFAFCCAVLKHRERLYTDKMNFVATIGGALVSQDVVRNMVVWQMRILSLPERPPELRIHGSLCIDSSNERAQIDRLMSLVCVSSALENFNIFFDHQAAAQELPRLLSKAEQRPQAEDTVHFDLSRSAKVQLSSGGIDALARAFVPKFESHRLLTNYLKVAHPRMFVVALSLPEDPDGFCDQALRDWLPHLRRLRSENPGIAFCLLNRTMLGQGRPFPGDLAPVRSLGFGFQDAIALAQSADAFAGCFDVFGLAALAARRPGVYLDESNSSQTGDDVCFLADRSPSACLGALKPIMLRQGPAWLREGQSAAPTDGRGEAR